MNRIKQKRKRREKDKNIDKKKEEGGRKVLDCSA